MSHEYDYPDDTPTREEMEQADADRNPPECICENAAKKLYNPDCYWHGTEGVEILETEPAMHECNDCGILTEKYRPICTLCERWYEQNGIKPPGVAV
jgi:hypothetical protein